MYFAAAVVGLLGLLSKGSDGCGMQEIPNLVGNGRVVGGQVATHGSWPWQAQLKRYNSHVCGGVLIAPSWVVTTAHCLSTYTAGQQSAWNVHVGSYNKDAFDSSQRSFQIKQVVLHPHFVDWKMDFNLALVEVDGTIPLNAYVQPACLPPAGIYPAPGTAAYMTGWGETKGTGGAGKLKQAMVEVFSVGRCRLFYTVMSAFTDNMLCAGTAGPTDSNVNRPCLGDTGGPLVAKSAHDGKWYAIGVTSHTDDHCSSSNPPVYTNIANFRQWILSIAGV